MGQAVLEFSDVAIVTSDNPRNEEPDSIIEQIICGKEDQFIIDLDRRSAICRAIDLSKKDDIVCIAGKGHEKYQEVAGKRLPFDDFSVAAECLKAFNSRSSEC
jgi:UDP-N-acetylmuramoyl-L-alanyl-D-glutamate--2,6-diaminopimelate ligase